MANTCESIVRVVGLSEGISSFIGLHFPKGITGGLDTSAGLTKMREMHPDYAHVFSDAGAWLTDWMYDEVGQSGLGLDATITLYIDSRWNEPIDWMQGVVALHPDLTFDISWQSYDDEFVGELHASNGLVTKHEVRSGEELTEDDKFVLGIEDKAEEDEPDFGQCGKCGQWVHFPCYTCIARQAFDVLAPKADAIEEEALMQYIDHVAENEGGK